MPKQIFREGDIITCNKFRRLTAGSVSGMDPRQLTYNSHIRNCFMRLDDGLKAGFKLIKPVKVDRNRALFNLDTVDETRATALFEVVDVRMAGGGNTMGSDYYPDALTIKARRMDKPEWVTFTVDCNFRYDSISMEDIHIVSDNELTNQSQNK